MKAMNIFLKRHAMHCMINTIKKTWDLAQPHSLRVVSPILTKSVPAVRSEKEALIVAERGSMAGMGLGGSVFQWHPEHDIGFGYVPTSLNILDLFNERAKTYQAEVLKCVAAL